MTFSCRQAVASGDGARCRRVEDVGKPVENDLRRVDAAQLAVVEEGHTLAAAHLVEIGCGGHDGDAALLQHAQHVPKLLAAHGVDARGRLVEEEHAGLMDQRTRERQLLLHAAREGTCLAVAEALYLRIDGLDAVVALVDGGAEEGGKELQVLLDGQVLIERELARHVAHPAPNVLHLAQRVVAIDRGRSLVGQQQGAENAEHRGLAGTVGTDQPEHLTLTDRERHVARGPSPCRTSLRYV